MNKKLKADTFWTAPNIRLRLRFKKSINFSYRSATNKFQMDNDTEYFKTIGITSYYLGSMRRSTYQTICLGWLDIYLSFMS